MKYYGVIQNQLRETLPGSLEICLKYLYSSESLQSATEKIRKELNIPISRHSLYAFFLELKNNGNPDIENPSKYVGGVKKIDIKKLNIVKPEEKDFDLQDIINPEENEIVEYIRGKGNTDIVSIANRFQKSPKQIEEIINTAIKSGIGIGKIPDGKAYWKDLVRLPWGESRLVEIDPIKDKIKFMAISDTHLGSRVWFRNEMIDFINYGWETGCQFGCHAGDILDGVNVYRGQIAESEIWSIRDQVNLMVEKFPKRKDFKWYFITGNHDLSTFKSTGYDPGDTIKDKRQDFEYLGMLRARVGVMDRTIELFHGGSPAYAQSYPIEKHIRATMSGTKPNILFHGHLHYGIFMPLHRNIHCFMAGCFQGETLWTISKSLAPTTGGWIIELGVDKKGFIKSIKFEWVSYYEGVRTIGGWQKE